MLRLANRALKPGIQAILTRWQNEVNAINGFPAQVAAASTLFSARNVRSNTTFKAVRARLAGMHGPLLRCAYCEDSAADEVEHVAPKHLYPEKVFTWYNYTYACGICNGKKNNHFAVFRLSDGMEQDITPPHPRRRPSGWQPTRPPLGNPLFINPRQENPLEFLWLDLTSTFRIDPLEGLNDPQMQRRAEYTRDELRLNRAALLRARRKTFTMMRSALESYVREKETSNRPERLGELRSTLSNYMHRTVWMEMVRQRELIPEVDALFARAAEALSWV